MRIPGPMPCLAALPASVTPGIVTGEVAGCQGQCLPLIALCQRFFSEEDLRSGVTKDEVFSAFVRPRRRDAGAQALAGRDVCQLLEEG